MSLEIILQVLDLATSTMYVDDWYSHPRWDGKIERELR